MDAFLEFNWISLLALSVVFLLFVLLYFLSKKIQWTFVILIALALGIGVGFLFKSADNSYLKWVNIIGDIYINLITALVAPVILVSIISSFITIKNKSIIKSIGVKSILWLLLSASIAIVLSISIGTLVNLGKGAGSIFENINTVSDGTVKAYSNLTRSFDEVIVNLFPKNIMTDIANNNVVAIIIISIALAIGYISVAKSSGEDKVVSFKNIVNATKRIVYRVLSFVIRLTPYAVLAIISVSASKIFTSGESVIQLLILLLLIYGIALLHTFIANGLLIRFFAKVNPIKFFKKIFPAQITAFTTQSSVGTLPVTIKNLEDSGVSEEVANFTAPLGTTIGMPGCTCIWPTLLAIFYVNAVGLNWGVLDYIILGVLALILSFGSAGVPGIAVVSSIALFNVIGLPVAAVILLMPINTISDMIRTVDNVSTAATASIIVAKETNELNYDIFNGKEEFKESVEENALSNSNDSNESIVSDDQACSFTPRKKEATDDSLVSEDQACSFTPRKKEVTDDDSLVSEDQACSFTPRKKETTEDDSLVSEDQACSFTPKKKEVTNDDSLVNEDQACSFTPRKKVAKDGE